MNKALAIFLALFLTAWTTFDTINDYMSEDKKYIKTGGVLYWFFKSIVVAMFLALGFL